jgi:hypothetical protein
MRILFDTIISATDPIAYAQTWGILLPAVLSTLTLDALICFSAVCLSMVFVTAQRRQSLARSEYWTFGFYKAMSQLVPPQITLDFDRFVVNGYIYAPSAQ